MTPTDDAIPAVQVEAMLAMVKAERDAWQEYALAQADRWDSSRPYVNWAKAKVARVRAARARLDELGLTTTEGVPGE